MMGVVERLLAVLLVLVASGMGVARAEGERQSEGSGVYDSLKFQDGDHQLAEGLATLRTGRHFRYLNNEDTQKLLTKIWSNPPGAGADALGTLVPTGIDLRASDSWVAIIRYEPEGHVSDDDANAIDYGDLLKEMQQGLEAGNKSRTEQGYSAIHLLGWAQEPHYDSATKKLYWAKRLKFDGSEGETLNYNIRILGRAGYLEVNVVADMANLATVNGQVESVLAAIDFNKGQLYADYDAGVDKAAAYGIAGLVAGGVMAKTGLLKAAIAFLLAFKKAIILGLVALSAPVWRLLRRFTGGKPQPASNGAVVEADDPSVKGDDRPDGSRGM